MCMLTEEKHVDVHVHVHVHLCLHVDVMRTEDASLRITSLRP